ncbi:MAG: hypothetical protein ABEH66_00235 [Halobacteriales archaeon]
MRRTLLAAVAVLVVTAGCFGGPSATDTPTPTLDAPTETDETPATPTATDTTMERTERTDDGSTGTVSPESDGGTPTATPTTMEPESRTPTATPTATPRPDRRTETPKSGGEELAPGITGAGVQNMTALREAHFEALNGSSFTIDVSERRRSESFDLLIENGSRAVNMDIAQANTTSGFYIRGDAVTRFNESQMPPKVYSYGSTTERFGVVFAYAILLAAYPAPQIAVGEFEADGTVTRDGEELIRLRAVGINETAVEESRASFAPENLTDMSGTVLVRPDGLIRNMSLDMALESGEARSVSYAVSGIGSTTASQPGWLTEAPQFEGALAADGKVFELTHAGGATLPAGSNLSLETGAFGGGLTFGNVSLGTPVSPGDTVYLYATGSLANATAHASVNEQPDLPSGALNLSERSDVQVSGTLEDLRFVIGTPTEDDSAF